jgi:Flp pilus assembly protein TadG
MMSVPRPLDQAQRRRSRAQAMTEFAIVAPVLFILLFGVLEGGFLLYTVGTARFAAGDAARQLSEDGNANSADQNALAVIRKTGLVTTSMGTITHVDIYRMNQQPDGTLAVDSARINSYQINGTALGSINWPATTRNVRNSQMDFLGITIYYQYNWKTGIFNSSGPLQLNNAVYIRLEPQLY